MIFSRSSKEKRQFVRLKSYCLVKYQRITPSDVSLPRLTNVKNISQTGLLFTASEKLSVGSILQIKINLPRRKKPLETLAQVIRYRHMSSPSKSYHIGISFLDTSKNFRNTIALHIDAATRDPLGKKLLLR